MTGRLAALCSMAMALLIAPAIACAETAPAVQAAPGEALTLQEAIAFALGHNPSVAQAQAQLEAANSTVARARSAELPLVFGQLQSTLNRQSANNAGELAQFGLSPSPNFSQNTAALQGSQSVYNLSNALQFKQAQKSRDAALQRLRLIKEQTTLGVKSSYYGLLQNARLATLAQSDVAYQRTLFEIAKANFKAGKVAGIDQLKAQVQLTSSQERLTSGLADFEDARQNLAALIGAPPETRFIVLAEVPPPVPPTLDRDALHATALHNRPEIAIAQAELDNALTANGLVDAPNRPIVSLSGASGNQVSPTTNAQRYNACINNLPLGISPAACQPGPSHFYTIGLTSIWSIPLVDWGSTRAAHRSARSAIEQQRIALEVARNQALIDVDEALRRVHVQAANLKLADANVTLSKQTADTAQVQYRVGLISQVDVSSAQQTYLQTVKDLLAAQIGYASAVDRLLLATGAL